MRSKNLLLLGKCILAGLAFCAGIILGGIVTTLLKLPAPAMPAGADPAVLGRNQLLLAPVFALSLVLLAHRLRGSYLFRWGVLTLFSWVTYSLNTVLESLVFTEFSGTFSFNLILYFFAWLFCAAATARLFRPVPENIAPTPQEPVRWWLGRLIAGALAFVPIYLIFGLIAIQFTGQYYAQNQFGLTFAGLDRFLPVLLFRSALFFLVSLPILKRWQGTRTEFVLSLGISLSLLVGLLYIIQAYWMPLAVRIPHALEIVADSLGYAWVLARLSPHLRLQGNPGLQPQMRQPQNSAEVVLPLQK